MMDVRKSNKCNLTYNLKSVQLLLEELSDDDSSTSAIDSEGDDSGKNVPMRYCSNAALGVFLSLMPFMCVKYYKTVN